MRTSELASRTGVNTETLRYYERRGLLAEPPRTSGGWRVYPPTAVGLLRFIKRAQDLGFTLDEVEELLQLDAGGPDSCDAARALAERRIDDLAGRIRDLQRMRDPHGPGRYLRSASQRQMLRATRGDGPPPDGDPMKLEVLHVWDCPNLPPLLEQIARVTDLPVTTRMVESDAEAARFGMAGSPTLLIDGVDPFATPDTRDSGISCRLYRDDDGRIVPVPTVDQLRDTIGAAGPGSAATGVLSAWRTRAVPLDRVEKAAHQAILRVFATTGRPPAAGDLDSVTAGTGRGWQEVLAALHEVDAIRLGPDGQIAVAYPFSADSTRHRVRIGARVEVHAMCAIDALGISSMLDQDTVITSVDVTSGQAITAATREGHTSWEPATTVIFIGAASGGGPSADCCCDYLNFFTDHHAAHAWTNGHPDVPGQILDQAEAEDLATRLFGHLLTGT